MHLKITTIIILLQCSNLKSYETSDSFYASSLAIYRNRAFLTLPRSSCYNNLTSPTLIETYFNQDYQNLIISRKFIYPSLKHQVWGDCDVLQDAIFLDVELKKGRLWVLDKGTKICPPKIIIYNLFNNFELLKFNFEKVASKYVKVFALDPMGPLAYVSSAGDNKLIVFSLFDNKWWFLNVIRKDNLVIQMDRLVLSKLEPLLYLTADKDHPLYYLNLTDVKILEKSKKRVVEANFIGNKLGKSSGIATDMAGGLNYFMTRDYAVVRWITNAPLTAEYHDVLYQSDEVLPYVSHLFQGPQNNIWALVNEMSPKECTNSESRKMAQLSIDVPIVHQKVVKVLKIVKKGIRKNYFAV